MKQDDLVYGFNFHHGHHRPLEVSKQAKQTPFTEAQEQENLFTWIKNNGSKAPELLALRHIPNGGYRGERKKYIRHSDGAERSYNPAGLALKRQGVLKGTLDNLLPIPRRGFASLWIELKVNDGELISEPKEEWDQVRERERLLATGNEVHVCWNWTEAAFVLVWYLDLFGRVILPSRHNHFPVRGHDERCGCSHLRVRPMFVERRLAA